MSLQRFALLSTLLTMTAVACTPTPASATLKVLRAKHYCTDAINTQGCSAGRVALKIAGTSTCQEPALIDAYCTIDLHLITRRNPEGVQMQLQTKEPMNFEKGKGEEKSYASWSRFTDPVRSVKIIATQCQFTPPPPKNTEDDTDVEDIAVEETTPVKAKVKATQKTPTKSEATPEETYELKLLKEQNRAKELEIEALKLKLQLKTLETGE